MILKKDYSRVYELILAELQSDGYMGIVNYLEENPPKKFKGTMYSADLVDALVAAKTNSDRSFGFNLGANQNELYFADMDSVRPHSNLRLMLTNRDRVIGKWFNTLKARTDLGTGAMTITAPPEQTYDDDVEFGYEEDPDENECECDVEGCTNTAVWKNPQTGVALCDEHFAEEVKELGGSHVYQPWDCEKDEYYSYREDL